MSHAPLDPLWRELRELLRVCVALFGDPASLYDDHTVARGAALAARGWLRALEDIARALLLAMAARLPSPGPRRAGEPKARRADLGAPAEDAAPGETPPSELWAGVAFCAVLPAGKPGRAAEAAASRFLRTRALAYRLEALIRVAEAPERYARRLSRRLRAQPALAGRLLRRPRAAGARPQAWDALAQLALAAAAPHARVLAPESG